MYRYQGTTADNYVCFGTTSKSECIENTDKYLYRIIEIDSNNQLKLIKNTILGTHQWHDSNENIIWPDSYLFKALNATETDTIASIFIGSSTYDYMAENTAWYNKVAITSWKYGDITSKVSYDGPTVYSTENAWTNTVSAKIGLMYIHDFYYAYGVGGAPGSFNNAKTTWLYSDAGGGEWTMSRYGKQIVTYYAWLTVPTDTSSGYNTIDSRYRVRPVFFLETSIQIIKGTGTIEDPFIIS